jgi:hypothetical protein
LYGAEAKISYKNFRIAGFLVNKFLRVYTRLFLTIRFRIYPGAVIRVSRRR